MQLKNRDISPPDFFRFTHPETGFVSQAIDWYTWQENIAAHRKANKLPPITPEEAEAQLCETLPPGHCKHAPAEKKNRSWVNTRLRFGDIAQGMKAYLALITSGFKTVSQEEADRRARICSGCYLRITPQGCGACVKLSRLITGELARKKTAHDSHLANKACAVCSCGVQSIVHFPMPLLEQADTPEKQALYPDFCWRQKTGMNYQPDAV